MGLQSFLAKLHWWTKSWKTLHSSWIIRGQASSATDAAIFQRASTDWCMTPLAVAVGVGIGVGEGFFSQEPDEDRWRRQRNEPSWVVGEHRHDLCPDFGEEAPITTFSENEILFVDFGDFVKDSEQWSTEDAILHSNETQRNGDNDSTMTTITTYAKYRTPSTEDGVI